MLQADVRRFEDINYGSGDDVSLILDENKLSSDTNDKTSEPAVLDPSVCSVVFFRQMTLIISCNIVMFMHFVLIYNTTCLIF